jgi:hypothetical protein
MSLDNRRQNVDYGFSQALQQIGPLPVIAKRAPTTQDFAALGTIWVDKVANVSYVLTSITLNLATWAVPSATGAITATSLSTAGIVSVGTNLTVTGTSTFTGAAIFNGSVTLNSGDIIVGGITADTLTITGATSLATTGANATAIGNTTGASGTTISVGTGNFSLDGVGASTYAIAPSTTTGTVTIGGAAESGALALVTGTGAINVGTTAVAKTVTLGNVTGATAVNINTGTGGIALNAAGAVKMQSGSVSAAAYAATLSTQVGHVTLTGQVLASGSTQALTITNTLCTTTTPILVTVDNLGSNDAQLTITRIQLLAGSFVVTVKNNGAAALNGDVHLTYWMLS